jgi:hypothetical protein
MEDQQAISEVVGNSILFVNFDEYGRADLEYVDRAGVMHFLYLDPNS